jgi:cytoskeleton protein RodZ
MSIERQMTGVKFGDLAMDEATDDGSIRIPPPERVGAFLRARREALGLSYADVANVVKLPAKRVEALEAERWDELPDGPFLRGFLRNVARALDLDAASLTARVDDSLMRSRNPESILVAPGSTRATLPRRSGPLEDRHGGRKLVYGAFVFAIVAALIAWSGTESFDRVIATGRGLLQGGSVASSTPTTKSEPAPAIDAAAQVANPAETLPVAAAPTTLADATPASTGSGSPATTSPASTSTSASPLALSFHFTEDCWVEVRDAEGKVLTKSLNTAGSDRAIEGEAPYSLIVGNAKGVDLHFRGQAVDLGPYTRDQVARLTLS